MKDFKVNDKDYVLRAPTAKDIQDAQKYHSKVFSDGLKDPNMMTQQEVRKTLEERGFFSPEQEAEISAFAEELKQKTEVLEAGGIELEEAEKLALEMRELREKILIKQSVLNEFFNQSIERRAADAREDFLLSRTVFEKGKKQPYCKDLDDYYSKQNDPVMFKAYSLFIGASEDDGGIYGSLPEIQFLREYGFMDEQYRLKDEEVKEKPKSKPFLKNGKPVKKEAEAKSSD